MLSQNDRQSVLPAPALARAGVPIPKSTQQVFHPGDGIRLDSHAGTLRRVADGCVALYQLLPDGRRQITDIIGPGGLFGCNGDGNGNVGARALTYTRVERVDADAAPALAAKAALDALERLRWHVMLLGRMTAAERTANALLTLARLFTRKSGGGSRGRVTFTLYLTRNDLADWLGLTVETVSRTLSQFKRDGLIEYRHAGIVTISRPEALAAIAFSNGLHPEFPLHSI